jgi:hypothetical protein
VVLTGYGTECISQKLVGEPGRVYSPSLEIHWARQDRNLVSIQNLQKAFSDVAELTSGTTPIPNSNLAMRADASIDVEGEQQGPRHLNLSVWGRPDLEIDPARSMPYGSLSVKTTASAMDQVQHQIAQAIAETIIGGADLAELLTAVRSAILYSPPGAMAA